MPSKKGQNAFRKMSYDLSNHSHHHQIGEPNIVGICAVCGDRADGHHYGVLSCRGCNAFFRRAVTFNLQFHCRRDGRCEINKNARCACRACRLQKCQAVGMDRAAVQVRREMKDVLALDGISLQRRGDCTALSFLNNQQNDGTDQQISVNSPVLGSARLLDMPSIKSRLLGSMSTAVPTNSNSPLATHPIDRLIEWYFCQRYRRQTMLCRTVEQILTGQIGDTFLGGGGGLPMASATVDDWCQVNKVQAVLMFEWLYQLEEFTQIEEPVDKTRLLRAFILRYAILDMLLHSLESGFTDRLALPNGTLLLPPLPCNGGTNEAMKMLLNEADSIVRTLLGPLANMGVTFGECMALRLLLFWDCSVPLKGPPNAELVRAAHERTVHELSNWLDQHSVEGTERRVAELIGMGQAIGKFAEIMERISRTIPEFRVMPEWPFMADLLGF